MAQRGSYAKGVAKREEILDTALRVIAENGFSGATLKQLADAVGLTQAGVLHHFDSKEELFAEVLARRDSEDARALPIARPPRDVDEMVESIAALLHHNEAVAGLVQLYERLASDATEPGHGAHAFFVERYRGIRLGMSTAIRGLQARGELPAQLDADRAAVVLVATMDGLQRQWMLDPSIDMADHVRFLLDTFGGTRPLP